MKFWIKICCTEIDPCKNPTNWDLAQMCNNCVSVCTWKYNTSADCLLLRGHVWGREAGAPEACWIRNSPFSTVGYRMTNLHLTSISAWYEGDLTEYNILIIKYLTPYFTYLTLQSFLLLHFLFWDQVLSSIYSHFGNSLLYVPVFLCFDTAEVPGSLFRVFVFQVFDCFVVFFADQFWFGFPVFLPNT